MARESQIRAWVEALNNSFGKGHVLASDEPFRALHAVGDYTAMAALIKEQLRLGTRMRIGRVKSGGPSQKPCWVSIPDHMPMYGSESFHETVVTLYIRRSFLEEAPHGAVVVAMAHEMSRAILSSMRHSLRDVPEAADLTAMLLGYRDFFLRDSYYERSARHRGPARAQGDLPDFSSAIEELFGAFADQPVVGYLTLEERRLATRLMSE